MLGWQGSCLSGEKCLFRALQVIHPDEQPELNLENDYLNKTGRN